jgi:hypothetical protein
LGQDIGEDVTIAINKVLVFSRRFHHDRMLAVAKALFPEASMARYTDEDMLREGVGTQVAGFNRHYQESKPEEAGEAAEEAIQRCRNLRFVAKEEALRRYVASLKAWLEILEREKPDVVVSLLVDSYRIDTLRQAAIDRDIPFVEPCPTQLPGRIRVRINGADYLPDNSELAANAESIAEEIMNSPPKPMPWLVDVPDPGRLIAKRVLLDNAKRLSFDFYRLVKRDPRSFSFAPKSELPISMIATSKNGREGYRAETEAIDSLPERFALMPLQFYPEATSDYWIPEEGMRDSNAFYLHVAKELRGVMPLVVKQHPVALGRYHYQVIRQLRKEPDVHFVSAAMPLHSVTPQAEVVIGYHSSSCWDAVMMGKPVLFQGTPWYGDFGYPVLTSKEPGLVAPALERARVAAEDPKKQERIKQNLMWLARCTAPGSIGTYRMIGERYKAAGPAAGVELGDEARRLVEKALEAHRGHALSSR